MKNLLLNERWSQGPAGTPLYFSMMGPITYDHFSMRGYRTCSITIDEDSSTSAMLQYDKDISVCHQRAIVFGCFIRAIDVSIVFLQAAFYDASNNLLEVCKKDIACDIDCEFGDVFGTFPIPCGAVLVKLSLHLNGKATAVTFGGPFAYFC